MTKIDPVAQTERRKYEKIWADPRYRVNSPGFNVAPLALEKLGARPGETLYDIGCGEGRAVDWFRSKGLDAVGVDLVKLRSDVIEACVWDLPDDMAARDYVFSADMMEHLPPDRVRGALENIKAKAEKAVFLTIATIDDVHGDRIGETLHLTVRPAEWWLALLKEVWGDVTMGQGDRDWRYWVVARG